jgi:uncharacterized protein with von Willebrand factor type A (vWA) domain
MSTNNVNKNIDDNEPDIFIKNLITTDVIVILDKSGSMHWMENEPVQALNAFIDEQKKIIFDNSTRFTLVLFNNDYERIIDNDRLVNINTVPYDIYQPKGGTALNDAVCSTIDTELASNKKDNKIVVIITDGHENCSRMFTTIDTKNKIKYCQDNHNWKFILIGANNTDIFNQCSNINIASSQCSKFCQKTPGDLMKLCRQTSSNIVDYIKSNFDGDQTTELLAVPNTEKTISYVLPSLIIDKEVPIVYSCNGLTRSNTYGLNK